MKVFEDYFSELQGDMVSICLEYVNGKAEEIYIYCSYEPEAYYFNVFYKVNGSIVHKHMLNEFSDGYVYDTSIERQKTLMKIGREDLEQIHDKFKEFNREMPTEMKLSYNVEKNSLNGKYSYDIQYSNSKDLMPSDIFGKWIKEVA